MRILGIDSSTPQTSIALLENDTLLAQTGPLESTRPSSSILTLLDNVLAEAGIGLDDVDGFAVTTGPGSFTGLRVGISLVKGFVISQEKPFVGVGTLEAWAATAGPVTVPVCPVLDARKKQVYAGWYQMRDGLPVSLQGDGVWDPEVLLRQVKEPTCFVGNGLKVYGDLLRRELGSRFIEPSGLSEYNVAACAARLARQRFGHEQTYDLNSLKINYIRKSEAELKYQPLTRERS